MNNITCPAGRLEWADLCRCVAIYGVILLHSCGAPFYQYGEIPLYDWLSANFLDSLVRCSVPIFVMLSGALILRRERVDRDVFFPQVRRRVIKVLVPLVVWSGIFLLYLSYHSGVEFNLLSIFTKPAMYHLWFVYMIIGLYLLVPLFQILFENIVGRRDLLLYIFLIWFVITCLPVYVPLPILSVIQQSSFFGYGGYFLIGGVIAFRDRDGLPTRTWFLLFLVSVIATFLITWYLSWRASAPVETGYLYFSPNVMISSVSAFVLFTRIKVSAPVAKLSRWVSCCSFFVYFVHVLVLQSVRYSSFISGVGQHAPVFVKILAISFATFVISLTIASIVRLVPVAHRVFG